MKGRGTPAGGLFSWDAAAWLREAPRDRIAA